MAAKIAKNLRLKKADTFTRKQYREFVSGRGVDGNAADARLVDASIRTLTNTTGRPLYSVVKGAITPSVLASSGLFVNVNGLLESPANADAPTRKVNAVIAPGGYLGRWCWANGAASSLLMLYSSAYTVEAHWQRTCPPAGPRFPQPWLTQSWRAPRARSRTASMRPPLNSHL